MMPGDELNMKNKREVTWEAIYREWEVYASHFGLQAPIGEVSYFLTNFGQVSKGSELTFSLLNAYQTNSEKYAAVWLASFCRDLMQDYAYLLDSSSYLTVNQVYFQSIKQFDARLNTWAEPLTRLQPKLFISHRMLENIDLTNLACLIELAMIQASLLKSRAMERMQ